MAVTSFLLTPLHFSPAKLRNTPHEYTNRTTHLLGKVMEIKSRRSQAVAAQNGDGDGGLKGNVREPSFSPFNFVTDNPSSRSAIQLPETPAEDGNVGQMLYRIEDKGRDYGSYVESGNLRWFVRETGSSSSQRGTIMFIHGAPTQSYSYREVMSQMSDAGFHCFAPDWIGFGFSDKPQPGYGFSYTEEEFHKEFGKLLDTLNINSPFFLVIQGFLVGSYGLTWALKNSDKVSKIAILNTLLEAARKANLRDILNRIATGFSSANWDKPVLLPWGASDKYLPISEAEAFQKANPVAIQLKVIEGAGHMPQEDWPEKVVEALRRFL